MEQFFGNPYLPNFEYMPDGEPHVFGDRLYVYGSHDRFGGEDFCLNDYVCWSAPVADLTDWRCEGVIYRAAQDPLYPAGADCRLFAPDIAQGADGRYYLYYGVAHSGVLHVAVCDTPAGAFDYYGEIRHPDGRPLCPASGDLFQYDPGILRDDDGRIWLYSGFCFDPEKIPKFRGLPENCQGAMVLELKGDMLTVKSGPRFIVPCRHNSAGTGFEGHAFFEASSVRKLNGRYYFIYSSEESHELCWAVSDAPDRGFRFGGVLVDNGDIGFGGRKEPLNYTGTNHGSIAKIGENLYIFYHRQSGGTAYARQGCAEKLTMLPDGSIPQVRITSTGLAGRPFPDRGECGAFRACALMSAGGACAYRPKARVGEEHPYFTQDGPDRESDPNQYIRNLRDGACAGFRSFRLDRPTALALRCRADRGGLVMVRGGEAGTMLAEIPIPPCGIWQETAPVLLRASGVTDLWLTFSGAGAMDLDALLLKDSDRGQD